jgi:hypothetical protein
MICEVTFISRTVRTILRVVSHDRAHADATNSAPLFLFQHQQRRTALGVSISVNCRRGSN